MQAFRLFSFIGTVGAVLALSACSGGDYVDLSMPSAIHTGKIRVREQTATETMNARYVNKVNVANAARDILRNGENKPSLTIPYAPGQAASAEKIGAAYKTAFAKQGVTHLDVALVPVARDELANEAVLAYKTLTATPDSGCKTIPGMQGAESLKGFDGYEYGCAMQSMTSKMVADPADLLGGAGHDGQRDGESRRAGTMVEPYKAGTPNEKLQGMQASTVGQ